MTVSSPEPPILRTTHGDFPLHEYHLRLAGRAWIIQHTGIILTHADESRFFDNLLDRMPYGVALWPAAIALACELAARGESLAGKTVLELGAGTGLPGIVAASLGARVVQTDRHELALSVCRRNGAQNGITGIEYRLVDWEKWDDTARYDTIIGSDILYADHRHPHLQLIFHDNLKPNGRVLLSDPFRGISIRCLEALEAQGWTVSMTKWALGEEENPRAVGVFELSPATGECNSSAAAVSNRTSRSQD